jgi:hypothetical protein
MRVWSALRPLSAAALLLLSCAALLFAGQVVAQENLGARRCATCHPAEYAHWKASPHARATASLTEAQRRDRRCMSCHATDVTNGHVGVQCESCHGPGEHYWPEHVMRDVELAQAVGLRRGDEPVTCARCHTDDGPHVTPFDYARALEAVKHPKAAPGKPATPGAPGKTR